MKHFEKCIQMPYTALRYNIRIMGVLVPVSLPMPPKPTKLPQVTAPVPVEVTKQVIDPVPIPQVVEGSEVPKTEVSKKLVGSRNESHPNEIQGYDFIDTELRRNEIL